MNYGLIAIGVVFFVIIGAIITRRCIEFMIFGGLLASLIYYKEDFLVEWYNVFCDVMYAEDSVWLVLVCCLFGSLIALLQASKGTFGFTTLIYKYCQTERKSLIASFILGILIFVDDYLNVLSIGACMRKVYDKNKMPREALAYLLDSTGAAVCTILPFSTWAVFFSLLFYGEDSVAALGYEDAISTYMVAIPFAFYPIFTIAVIFLFCIGVIPKLGPMKSAYKRVEETGKVYSDVSRKFNHDDLEGYEETSGNIWDFIIPMGVLVAIGVVTGDLIFAVLMAIFVCFVQYVPRKVIAFGDFIDIVIKGFGDMLSIVAIVLMGFMLEGFLSAMGMTEYIIETITPILSPEWFAAIIFILVAFLTFTTGSNWGMTAVCVPIVFPLGAAVGADVILTMGALMSGCVFGSHACFYSDATVLASSSAGIDNIEHAASQIPYVAIASGLSVIAFLICGYTM